MTNITMNINEIRQYLPHRYPFLFIDRVIDLKINEYIHAYKNISVNEEVFQGHFPYQPIFPGVLIIEAMAQASGILGFKTMNVKPDINNSYLFIGCEKCRFKNPVVPGDRLDIHAKLLKKKNHLWKFDCSASVDNKPICSAIILCADKPLK